MSLSLAIDNDPTPTRIGKYPIARLLGYNAATRVYLGIDPGSRREVAIKLMSASPGMDPALHARARTAWMAEAARAAMLSHPQIAGILDVGSDHDQCWTVSEHIAGGSLLANCEPESLLSQEQVVEVAIACALALEYANQKGVIHRNVKPANILRLPDGGVKLADFASVRAIDGGEAYAQAPSAYDSPEQTQGMTLTGQTDIYSLGVTMYQLLTGLLPHADEGEGTLAERIVGADPLPAGHHRPELNAALEAAVMKAMARDPQLRYADWPEFTADLSEAKRQIEAEHAEESGAEHSALARTLAFFRDFEEVELREAIAIGRARRFPAGRTIMREGDRGSCFYVLLGGEVEITRSGRPIDILTPGDSFGEMLYFSQSSARRTASVVTLTATLALEIDSSALRAASEATQARFNKAFMRILIERLTWATAKLAAA